VFIELYQQKQLLKARNQALEHALTLNETMMAVLTHDLRTPLSAILLCADKLSLDLPDDPSVQQTLVHLENSAVRMARMVEQLLDFSRIRSGGLRLQQLDCDLAEVAAAVVSEMSRAHPQARIELKVEGNTCLHGDPDRLAQLLSNLVGNAVLHGGHAPVQVVVRGLPGDSVRLEVRNAGQIPEALLPRLFEPFKASFHDSRGLGLGLFIAHEFARAHGGTLVARNLDGEVLFEAGLQRRER